MSLGFYRGNKNVLLADAQRIAGVRPLDLQPGAIGTWVRPPSEQAALATALDEAGVLTPAKNAEMSAAAGMDIGTTDVGPTKMSRTTATQMGYTGDACDNCGSMKVKISGHCTVCDDCGTTSGCS